MAKQDNRRPKGDTGEAEIYTAETGTPPVDPDMGSVKGAKPMPMPKPVKKMAKGGAVKSASARADGIAQRGKTRGKIV
jgi:hypothetical protein